LGDAETFASRAKLDVLIGKGKNQSWVSNRAFSRAGDGYSESETSTRNESTRPRRRAHGVVERGEATTFGALDARRGLRVHATSTTVVRRGWSISPSRGTGPFGVCVSEGRSSASGPSDTVRAGGPSGRSFSDWPPTARPPGPRPRRSAGARPRRPEEEWNDDERSPARPPPRPACPRLPSSGRELTGLIAIRQRAGCGRSAHAGVGHTEWPTDRGIGVAVMRGRGHGAGRLSLRAGPCSAPKRAARVTGHAEVPRRKTAREQGWCPRTIRVAGLHVVWTLGLGR